MWSVDGSAELCGGLDGLSSLVIFALWGGEGREARQLLYLEEIRLSREWVLSPLTHAPKEPQTPPRPRRTPSLTRCISVTRIS